MAATARRQETAPTPITTKVHKNGEKRRRLNAAETNALMKKHGIEIDGLPLDDSGHAQRMFNIAEDEGADIAFLTREGGGTWMIYDVATGMWSRHAPKQKIGAWVISIGDLLLDWAETLKMRLKDPSLPAEDKADMEWLIGQLLTQGARLRSSGGISAVRNVAENFPKYHVPESDFDQDPDHVIVQNGVIDLRTSKLLPHSPKFLISRRIDVFYDSQAKAPTFMSFLAKAFPDVELRDRLPVHVGYWLTGYNTEQVMWMFLGVTGTGKSTFSDAICNVLGKVRKGGYSMKAPRGLFRKDQAHWGDTATLINARLAIDSEYAEQTVVDAALVKMLTGEQDITANKKYGPHLMFDLTAKFLLMSNYPPKFDSRSAQDEAVFRRIFVVPMNVQMYAGAFSAGTYRTLPEKLKAEAPGILAWMVAGAKRWYQEPLHKHVPAIVQSAGVKWRQSMGGGDMIREALEDAGFVFRNDVWTSTADLLAVINPFLVSHQQPEIGPEKLKGWANTQGLTKKEKRPGGMGYLGVGR